MSRKRASRSEYPGYSARAASVTFGARMHQGSRYGLSSSSEESILRAKLRDGNRNLIWIINDSQGRVTRSEAFAIRPKSSIISFLLLMADGARWNPTAWNGSESLLDDLQIEAIACLQHALCHCFFRCDRGHPRRRLFHSESRAHSSSCSCSCSWQRDPRTAAAALTSLARIVISSSAVHQTQGKTASIPLPAQSEEENKRMGAVIRCGSWGDVELKGQDPSFEISLDKAFMG